MPSKQSKNATASSLIQLVVGFVIPTIILLNLSDPSRLGPIGAMFLALAFPVALELYGLTRRRKPSYMALVAIAGILFVGLMSVLELSNEWLAVRRSALYGLAAIGVFVVVRFKPHLIEKGLDRVLDMEQVKLAGRKNKVEERLTRYTIKIGYILAVFLAVITIASYVLTIVFMTAPAGTSEFNAQYAELRLLSLGVISLPLLIGMTILLASLVNTFEKLTGIGAEQLLKKK